MGTMLVDGIVLHGPSLSHLLSPSKVTIWSHGSNGSRTHSFCQMRPSYQKRMTEPDRTSETILRFSRDFTSASGLLFTATEILWDLSTITSQFLPKTLNRWISCLISVLKEVYKISYPLWEVSNFSKFKIFFGGDDKSGGEGQHFGKSWVRTKSMTQTTAIS